MLLKNLKELFAEVLINRMLIACLSFPAVSRGLIIDRIYSIKVIYTFIFSLFSGEKNQRSRLTFLRILSLIVLKAVNVKKCEKVGLGRETRLAVVGSLMQHSGRLRKSSAEKKQLTIIKFHFRDVSQYNFASTWADQS